MGWATLDDLFPEHPKVIAAGGDAAWLFVSGLCFAHRAVTDGLIPKNMVPRLTDRKAPERLARRLVEVGLWHDEGASYRVHDWQDYNDSAETVKARKEHARRAAMQRWRAQRNAKGNAPSIPGAPGEHSGEDAQGNAPPDAQTMLTRGRPRSPNSHIVNNPSPTDSFAGSPAEDDDDGSRIDKALALVAERRLAKIDQSTMGNPRGWTRKVVSNLRAERGDDLKRWAERGWSAEHIADELEPPEQRPPYHRPFGENGGLVWAEDEHGNVVRAENS